MTSNLIFSFVKILQFVIDTGLAVTFNLSLTCSLTSTRLPSAKMGGFIVYRIEQVSSQLVAVEFSRELV